MNRIKVLEQAIADRIAAGEVVERPASVVKELVENSLDAQATQILIEVEGAGAALIRVGDDGSGIHPDDVRLAVQRFATSKIATAGDLDAIQSFGFRGEALPSIAAVSVMEIASAPAGAPAGRRLRMEGGEIVAEETIGMPGGTVVTVRQLFFNTPARRKFLKSTAREFSLLIDAINRLALAHPAVSFRVIHEGAEVLRYPPGTAAERVAAVLGEDVSSHTLAFSEDAGGMRASGWLGRLELARGNRRQQYLFVNRRPVHSRLLTGAVERAYQQLLPGGRYPAFVIFLEAPPQRVDVNVHPRKLEVRFDDEHQVFGAVERLVHTVLRRAQLIRAVEPVTVGGGDWLTTSPGTLALGDLPPAVETAPPVEVAASGRLPSMRLLGQVQNTYLVADSADGLILIDQHAAHERVLYERLLRARGRGAADGQVQVTPTPLPLQADAFALLTTHQALLAQLGFDLEPFGDRTVLIRAVPQIAVRASPQRLLADLIADLAEGGKATAAQTLLERLTITTACKTAIKAGDTLGRDQMAALMRDLAQTEDPFTCFHGRPTLITVPLAQLERWFLRH